MIDTDILLQDASEEAAQAYLYWTATERIAVSFEVRGSRFRPARERRRRRAAGHQFRSWRRCRSATSIRSGFFAVGGVEYVGQSVTRRTALVARPRSWGDSWLVDAAIGYRLPGRSGIVSLELNNLLDQKIHWQDDTFRSSEQQNRRFIPERSAMVRVNLNF